MRSWPAALTTHLQREVLNVASCWRVTRQDGVVLRFTDHDADVLLDLDVSDPGEFERFLAQSGFTRSTILEKADLSVNDLDVQGLLDSELITDDDLRAGKFDHALVEIFLVNWDDPVESEIGALKQGRLGQTTIRDTGYEVELRGLMQGLQVEVGDVYAPLCRVDLFSTPCGLNAADFRMSGTVVSVTSGREFLANAKDLIRRVPVPLPAVVDKTDFSKDAPNPALTDFRNLDVNVDDPDQATKPDFSVTSPSAASGDGTPERPFIVSNSTQLNNIRNAPTAHYRMTADIDMTGFGNWEPIPVFAGTLDGAGYEIQNLDLTDVGRTETVVPWGFIGVLAQQGVVKRLGLDNANADLNAASTVPMGTMAGRCIGVIEDCYSINGSVNADATSGRVGGFVGHVRAPGARPGNGIADVRRRGTVRRCYAANTVSGTLGATDGGFAGEVDSRAIQASTYFDSTVAGTTQKGTGSNATDLTTAQIQDSSNLAGFDLASVWKANDPSGYSTILDPGRDGATTNNRFMRFEAIDLSALGTYDSGNISWTEDVPLGTDIDVYISTDGETFSVVSNGGALPGFSASQSLAGVQLTVLVDFTNGFFGNDPTLKSLTISVQGEGDAFADSAGPPVLSPSDDDWFVGGLVTWTSGLNAGLSMEVKQWTFATKTFKLFLQMPFGVQVGDEFDVVPGCKKRLLADCRDKYDNVPNHRAEPYVPGTDKLLAIPDAQSTGGSRDDR